MLVCLLACLFLGSLMERHPRFQLLIALIDVFRHSIFMKDFGGESAKGTWLYSSAAEIFWIDRFKAEPLLDL